jgi:hypothetical protein
MVNVSKTNLDLFIKISLGHNLWASMNITFFYYYIKKRYFIVEAIALKNRKNHKANIYKNKLVS